MTVTTGTGTGTGTGAVAAAPARGGTAPVAAAAARPRRRPRIRSFVPPSLVLSVLLVLAWQFYVTRAHVAVAVLPSPLRVLEQGWADREHLLRNTLPTLQETGLGFALSIAVGWTLAVVCDFSPLCRRALEPLLVVSQTIPVIAIAPLFVIWFGFTTLPKVLIVALVTFFPLTVSLLRGFAATPVDATNLLRSMGANRVQRFLRLRVPTSLPYFFSGLRISITYAVVGAIFGEYVGAESGLGIYMQISKNGRRTDLVLAAVVVTALLSLLLYGLVALLERVVLRWERQGRPAARRGSGR
jgi:ABC-type nitrate/sulfonate/bicarbonate transport system permease component